ncbi:hypothetical protein RhiirC2_802433, partial [Rhizophagus irregularis]
MEISCSFRSIGLTWHQPNEVTQLCYVCGRKGCDPSKGPSRSKWLNRDDKFDQLYSKFKPAQFRTLPRLTSPTPPRGRNNQSPHRASSHSPNGILKNPMQAQSRSLSRQRVTFNGPEQNTRPQDNDNLINYSIDQLLVMIEEIKLEVSNLNLVFAQVKEQLAAHDSRLSAIESHLYLPPPPSENTVPFDNMDVESSFKGDNVASTTTPLPPSGSLITPNRHTFTAPQRPLMASYDFDSWDSEMSSPKPPPTPVPTIDTAMATLNTAISRQDKIFASFDNVTA